MKSNVALTKSKNVFIETPRLQYIKNQLETTNSAQAKKALQDLCKLLRSGFLIHPNEINGVEITVVGVLATRSADEKIRRWALNALARFGRGKFSLDPIKDTLVRFGDDPQTAASAIAAIYKMEPEASKMLSAIDAFDPILANLAALQHTNPTQLDLRDVTVDVEQSSSDVLKLALIVVGLNRAPPNLFDPRHSNAEIVRVLGGHDDATVSQYSIWAITENAGLGLADLGIDIRDIENQPPNVRSWIFQLIAMSRETALENLQFIELGMRDPDAEVRVGMANGLREIFFDGLEPLVLDWFCSETDPDVHLLIVDHMVRQSGHCPQYARLVTELYEKEAPNSCERQRMEAIAAGTELYSDFRRIAYSNGRDLFEGSNVTKNIHFHGNVQAGALSVNGSANNSASVSNRYDARSVRALKSQLSKARREISKLEIDETLKGAVLEDIKLAHGSPEPALIEKAINGLRQIEAVALKVVGTSTVLGTIIAAIQLAAGH